MNKGKAKEESSPLHEWWHYIPLTEPNRPPLAWSRTGILTAHATAPAIVCQSADLKSPPQTLFLPTSASHGLLPPTIISVSSNNEWLFAYFPSNVQQRQLVGAAGLWNYRNGWVLHNLWHMDPGKVVVCVKWTDNTREWTSLTSRMPPLGPSVPLATMSLLLLTQDQTLNLLLIKEGRDAKPPTSMISCSLTFPDFVAEGSPPIMQLNPSANGMRTRICVKGDIGFGYQDDTVVVAMRTITSPNTAEEQKLPPDNLVNGSSPEQAAFVDSHRWGENQDIELCEVVIKIKSDGIHMAMKSHPLSPIIPSLSGACTSLKFIPAPRPPKVVNIQEKPPKLYLCTSFLDFLDYNSTPRSQLALYSFIRRTVQSGMEGQTHWIENPTPNIMTFPNPSVLVSIVPRSPFTRQIYVVVSGDEKRTAGFVRVLSLPDLSHDPEWQDVELYSSSKHRPPIDSVPLNAIFSPNEQLLATVSESPSFMPQIAIQRLPTKGDVNTRQIVQSRILALALITKRPVGDIVHLLSLVPPPGDAGSANSFEDVPAHALEILGPRVTLGILGLMVEVYRARSKKRRPKTAVPGTDAIGLYQIEHSDDMDLVRAQAAHSMCTYASINKAFDECRESGSSGTSYDLDVVWQLLALTRRILDSVQAFMRECVIVAGPPLNSDVKMEETDTVMSSVSAATDTSSDVPTSTPALFPFAHPSTLGLAHSCLKHVAQFYAQVKQRNARGENAQIAKEELLSLVEGSGINIQVLSDRLGELRKEVEAEPGKLGNPAMLRRALVRCEPSPVSHAFILGAIRKILASPVPLDKPKLFLRAQDLVSSIGHDDNALHKASVRDVVTHTLLQSSNDIVSIAPSGNAGQPKKISKCLRCGGLTEVAPVPQSHLSLRWVSWEKRWSQRCICGGEWNPLST